MKNKNHIKGKLSKAPYRGILTEIAREEDVTPNAVWNAVYIHNNLRIIGIVVQKMKERKSIAKRQQREMMSC